MDIIIPKYLLEYFESLEKEHGITLSLPQKQWYTMKYKELGEEIRQEYPSTAEEAFMGSSDGFWYLKEINMCRTDGKITRVPFQPQCTVQTAWDLGYRDKTAIWFFQLLPSGTIHVIDYYENSGEGLAFYHAYIKNLPYHKYITMHHLPHDAAAHEKGSGLSLEQQAKELGMNTNILKRYNASNSTFLLEVQRVRTTLSRCYFDEERCAVGIKCLENYRKKWNESMACYTDSAIHDFASHACFVGDTPISTSKGSIGIKDIAVGDLVETPSGLRKVTNKFKYVSRDLYKINDNMIVTGNHKIFTERGLIYCDTLRYSDKIYAEHKGETCKKYINLEENIGFREAFTSANVKDLFCTVGITGDGTDIITNQVGYQDKKATFTEQFGLKTIKRSLKDIIYTIKIITRKIMNLITCNVYPVLSIYHYQPRTAHGLEAMKISNSLSERSHSQKNGTLLKKGEPGINQMERKVSLRKKRQRKNASFATSLMKHFGQITQGSVTTIASHLGDGHQGQTMKKEIAPNVMPFMSAINILRKETVQSIVRVKKIEEVFDIEVENEHCYYANGYLVSNSDSFRYMCQAIETQARTPDKEALERERRKIREARRQMI